MERIANEEEQDVKELKGRVEKVDDKLMEYELHYNGVKDLSLLGDFKEKM